MRPLLSTLVLFLTAFAVSVQSQSGIYNNTECMAADGKITWTVEQPRYYNATIPIQEVGPPVGRILTMLIVNNDAQFTVRCPGDLITDPYSPKTTMQASCSTDFRGYYFPPKTAVGDVWMSAAFDERDYSLLFTQTWWCQENALAPLYNVTATGSGTLFSSSLCSADLWGTTCMVTQVTIVGDIISRQIHTQS